MTLIPLELKEEQQETVHVLTLKAPKGIRQIQLHWEPLDDLPVALAHPALNWQWFGFKQLQAIEPLLERKRKASFYISCLKAGWTHYMELSRYELTWLDRKRLSRWCAKNAFDFQLMNPKGGGRILIRSHASFASAYFSIETFESVYRQLEGSFNHHNEPLSEDFKSRWELYWHRPFSSFDIRDILAPLEEIQLMRDLMEGYPLEQSFAIFQQVS